MGIRTVNLPQSSLVDTLIGNAGGSSVQVPLVSLVALVAALHGPSYATLNELEADLAWASGTQGYVTGDAVPEANGRYRKDGAADAGSWTRIGDLDAGVAALLAAAEAAAGSADLSQEWAEGTEPGGPGTKSAKEHAEDAEATAETLADLAALEQLVTNAETAEDNAEGHEVGALDAQTAAESARDAVLLSRGLWPTTAAGMGSGVAGTASLVAGSGGTDGTFALAVSGGTQVIAPVGVFVVASGALVSILITHPGYYSAGTPTLDFSASSGLTGASATAVMAANTPVGGYFLTPFEDDPDLFMLYRVDAGPVATPMNPYPSSAAFAAFVLNGIYSDASLPGGYEFVIMDADDAVAFGVTPDGTVETKRSKTETALIGDDELSRNNAQGWGAAMVDASGRAGTAISPAGRFAAHNPIFKGNARRVLKSGLRFPGDLNFINNTGQSNSHGTTGTGTEGISQAARRGALGVLSGTYDSGLYELTNRWFGREDAVNGWKTENPIFGAVGFILELLEKEDGIDWQSHDVRFIGSNNGLAGQTLAQLSDGGASGKFEAAIAQAEIIEAVASNAGLTPSFGMTMWLQGEAEAGSTTYKAALVALMEDFRDQGKTATGQKHDPIFVTWQLSISETGADKVSRAQLEAANENALIYCTGPTYHLPRLDGTHFTPTGYKWLGAYFGLVYKRVVLENGDWQPLQPVHHAVIGNAIDLHFNKRGLVLDTAGDLPAQTNYGFAVTQADGTTPVTISSVAIVGPDRVRITCASAPAAGWRVKYGHTAMTGITAWTYTGPGGNLRDSAGDYLTYDEISEPMHNWCCIFNYEV